MAFILIFYWMPELPWDRKRNLNFVVLLYFNMVSVEGRKKERGKEERREERKERREGVRDGRKMLVYLRLNFLRNKKKVCNSHMYYPACQVDIISYL